MKLRIQRIQRELIQKNDKYSLIKTIELDTLSVVNAITIIQYKAKIKIS